MRELVRDRERLEHIIDAIDRLQSGIENKSLDELYKDKLAYYGLVKNLEIIGEASYRLTKAFRDSHPDTLWEKNEKVVIESAMNKQMINTAMRMMMKGYDVKDISDVTGMSVEDIESL